MSFFVCFVKPALPTLSLGAELLDSLRLLFDLHDTVNRCAQRAVMG